MPASHAWRAALSLIVSAILAACGGGQQGANPEAAAPADPGGGNAKILATKTPIGGAGLPAGFAAWSNPATWGGSKPAAGAAVVIPAGMRVAIDENTPALASLTIEGEVAFVPSASTELQAGYVLIKPTGALRAGSADAPMRGRATITLLGNPDGDAVPGMGTRGILVMGGKLELFGTGVGKPWLRLTEHAEAGSSALALESTVKWNAGDRVVIAPTEWYPNPDAPQAEQDAALTTELRTVGNLNKRGITLTEPLAQFKWGRMQYVTDAGLSLTPGTFTKPDPNAADRLDERAEVGNLTRNIVIQGADDAPWQDRGFGAHVMVMNLGSSLKMDGVELRRVGQAGVLGRYPIHWHLLSYAPDGSELGDATGHYVRNSSVWNSRQRCMVIHGTNGVELRDNICYDIKGHAIFLEDAVERRNVIEGNLVLKVRSPAPAQTLAEHEKPGTGCGASSGYWLTNPDNTVRGNAVADAQGNGYWLAYPTRPVKQSAKVPLQPQFMKHAPFELNSTRSNGNNGLLLDCAMVDDAGHLGLLAYSPTVDGSPFNWSNAAPFTISDITTAKNRGGYVNRAISPTYRRWVAAGNIGRAFSGSVQANSSLKQSLLIGKSLNDRQPYPVDVDPQLGVASYHSTMDIAQNTFVNFSFRPYSLKGNGWDRSAGAFGTDDYYMNPLEKGFFRNPGNVLINAEPGYRALPPHLQPNYTVESLNHWTLAGAIWDPQGYWGAAGRWWTFDHPFLRDASCTPVVSKLPVGQANGLSCAGPYYGVHDFTLNKGLPGDTTVSAFSETIDITRLDAAGKPLGNWRVDQGYTSTQIGHMRHFVTVKGGTYVLRFPSFPESAATKQAPKMVKLSFDNLLSGNDSFVLGIHYDGATTPGRVLISTSPAWASFGVNAKLLTAAASKAELLASTDGSKYWRDPANDLIWVKPTALGLEAPWANAIAGSDNDLYRSYGLVIEP